MTPTLNSNETTQIAKDTQGGTHLTGLEGTNPLGFLAALGVQILFENEPEKPKLWWSDDVIPHAIVDESFTVERIANQALKIFPLWAKSPALSPTFGGKAKDDAKFSSTEEIRKYLDKSISCQHASSFATALLAEESVDNSRKAKPTDLYFTAGTMYFLKIGRAILTKCTGDDLKSGLQGPWKYESELPTLKWDITDDRIYALSAINPSDTSKNKKLTNPGPEALAIIGMSTHPVFRGKEETLTTGCSGTWKKGYYTWPIWNCPAGLGAVKSLLYQATSKEPNRDNRSSWFKSWGISMILKSEIKRSDQGGYGTFLPPEIILHRKEKSIRDNC